MKYFWNEHTLEAYREESHYKSKEEIQKDVVSFVEYNCQLEDGDTNEMLVDDLLLQIYNKKK